MRISSRPRTSTQRTHPRIWDVVRRVPRGRVATYGQIARLAGLPGQARLVGYALNSLPGGSRVPWHRVVNALGRISPRSGEGDSEVVQRLRLEREGVCFGETGSIDLARFRWRPRGLPRTLASPYGRAQ